MVKNHYKILEKQHICAETPRPVIVDEMAEYRKQAEYKVLFMLGHIMKSEWETSSDTPFAYWINTFTNTTFWLNGVAFEIDKNGIEYIHDPMGYRYIYKVTLPFLYPGIDVENGDLPWIMTVNIHWEWDEIPAEYANADGLCNSQIYSFDITWENID